MYVICQLEGPYNNWEKLCLRSWIQPEAAGRTQDQGHSSSQYGPFCLQFVELILHVTLTVG